MTVTATIWYTKARNAWLRQDHVFLGGCKGSDMQAPEKSETSMKKGSAEWVTATALGCNSSDGEVPNRHHAAVLN